MRFALDPGAPGAFDVRHGVTVGDVPDMRHLILFPILAAASLTAGCAGITHRGVEIERTETLSVADTQRFLLITGYDAGRVDGIPGPETQSALAAFAAAEGLQGSGAITPDLSHRLRQVALRGDGSDGLGGSLAAMAAATGFPSVPKAQRALTALGYQPGPIDGILGPHTAGALRAFQGDNALPVTGRLDAATAAKLDALSPG